MILNSLMLRNIVFLLICVCSLFAQSPTATLVGRIQDPSGASVPGARVDVTNSNTAELRSASSNADGEFAIPNLRPGSYDVAVEAAGFRAKRETGLTLQVDQTARLDVQLSVGSQADSIEVKADMPLLNTENASKGDVVVNEEITEMPLAGRSFGDLALLVPGVAPTAEGGHGSPFAVNGARSDNTNFVLDGLNTQNPRGGNNQVNPPLDAMQEFKMQTTGFSAEYGRLAGGVMSMVLKTGGNRLHGSLSEFLRNDALDARDFFSAEKQPLRRNQFGVSLDGPVVLPKLYDGRNRTFFLFTWESTRSRAGATTLTRVPESTQHGGDFSDLLDANGVPVLLKDPLAKGQCGPGVSAACFPGNRIPVSRIDATGANIAALFPAPNRPGQKNNYLSAARDQDDANNLVAKVDQRISGADSVSFRFMAGMSDSSNPYRASDIPGFGSTRSDQRSIFGLTYTHIFAPTVINEFRGALTRLGSHERNFNSGHDYTADLGLPSAVQDSYYTGYPRVVSRDYATLGDSSNVPNQAIVNVYQWGDTLTWVRKQHLLKFGGEILRSQFFEPENSNVRGVYNFQGKWTNSSFADLLLGLPNSTSRSGGVSPVYLFTTNFNLFAQDDYRVTSNLTLNLGIRYEITKPYDEKYGHMATFIPEIGKLIVSDGSTVPDFDQRLAATGLTGRVGLAGDYGLPHSLAYTQYHNFAPRVGFAWRPSLLKGTVVRSGYGIFFSTSIAQPLRNDMAATFPFVLNETYNRAPQDPNALKLSNPFPAERTQYSGVTSASGMDPRSPSQNLQSWNFTIERSIGRGSAIEIGYVGSKGTHLGRQYDVNQPFRTLAGKLPDGTFARPFPGWNSINYYSFNSNSSFNSVNLTLRRRFTQGLFFRANYTFGKSIDDASQIANASSGGYPGAQDSRNLGLERGRSDWDSRHNFTLGFSYDLPLGQRQFLKGWQLAGTSRMSSGQPFTPRVTGVDLNLGEANRPDRIANGGVDNPTPERWYDVTAFPLVPSSSYRPGTSGRNILDGPGSMTVNLGLHKRFPIRDRSYIQFRWEAFNASNHTNFRMPDRFVNGITAATITNTAPARSMQLALRFVF
jgi:outer membrane receptor protein involved in Fe transport